MHEYYFEYVNILNPYYIVISNNIIWIQNNTTV